ncbi:ParB/RepB/Spo0J family partition protein [Methylothermus subterraneus]
MAKKFKLSPEKLDNLQKNAKRKSNTGSYLETDSMVEISLDLLDPAPWNARRHYDEKALNRLANDIKMHGLIHPVTVRPKEDGRFEVVAGERRYRACKLIGLSSLKAHIRQLDDATAHQMSLLENLNREDLSPYEETLGYLQLLAIKLSGTPYFTQLKAKGVSDQDAAIKVLNRLWNEKKRSGYRATNNVISPEIAGTKTETIVVSVFEELGKLTWESFFQNRLPILRLPDDLIQALNSGALPYTKARILGKIEDENTRRALTNEAIQDGYSVAKLRKIVAAHVPRKDEEELLNRLSRMSRKIRSDGILQDSKKRRKLEKLIQQFEELIAD